jgi:hypothetical protein
MSRLVSHAEAVLSEESLPLEFAGWERIGFELKKRESGDPFGMRSATWRYRRGLREAVVSLDYPFQGWHNLTVCYRLVEWNVRERTAIRTSADPKADPPYLIATMDQLDSKFGYLLFGMADDQGRWVDPPVLTAGQITDRQMPWDQPPDDAPTYQFQAFCTSYVPLEEKERQDVARLFEASRRTLHERLFSRGGIAR